MRFSESFRLQKQKEGRAAGYGRPAHKLEHQFQGELYFTSSPGGSRYLAKRSVGNTIVRITQVRMVEDIEEFRPELHAGALI